MHKTTAVEPKSGQSETLELPRNPEDFFEAMGTQQMPESFVKRTIDGLNISADAKALLYTLSKTTIVVGERVLKIGRKILDYACKVFKEFTNTAFGLVLGGVAGALFAAIPGLGQLLGPIISPILVFLGFLGGVFLDFKDKMVSRQIATHVAEQNRKLAEQIDLRIAEISGAAN